MAKVNNKTKGFNSITRDLVYDNSLSDRARFLYVYMACKPPEWEYYQDKVAEELGYEKRTLRKYLDELIERGWIIEESQENPGKFGALQYTIEIERKRGENLPIRKKTDMQKMRIAKNVDQRDIDNISSKQSLSDKEIENKKRLSVDNPKNKRFVKPTVEQIQAYIDEKKLSFDAERFFDYYESKGWLVGKSPMKDWKAACRNWDSIRKREIKEEKKKTYDILPDDSDKCQRFKNWMRENHTEQENCLKPLSFDGYMRLQREYGKDEVCFQLDYIDANIGRFLQSDIEASIRLHFKREEQ